MTHTLKPIFRFGANYHVRLPTSSKYGGQHEQTKTCQEGGPAACTLGRPTAIIPSPLWHRRIPERQRRPRGFVGVVVLHFPSSGSGRQEGPFHNRTLGSVDVT